MTTLHIRRRQSASWQNVPRDLLFVALAAQLPSEARAQCMFFAHHADPERVKVNLTVGRQAGMILSFSVPVVS